MRRWRVLSLSFRSPTRCPAGDCLQSPGGASLAFTARRGIAKQCPERDDRRVLSGIIFINRNGLRWRDAPAAYGPHKTLYNRWKRWSAKGIFARMMIGLAADHGEQKTIMIDATYLKAHRTATSMGVKKGGVGA